MTYLAAVLCQICHLSAFGTNFALRGVTRKEINL